MHVWQFLARADDRLDLADPVRATEWYAGQPWAPRPFCPDGFAEYWPPMMRAFRSLVRRLKGRRLKHGGNENVVEADRILADALASMKPDLLRASGATGPITKRDLWGVRLIPAMQVNGRMIALPHVVSWHEPRAFWQSVLYSLVADHVEPLCESCGKQLAPSKGGKQSRRRKCRLCSWQAWKRRQPKEKMRALWRKKSEDQS